MCLKGSNIKQPDCMLPYTFQIDFHNNIRGGYTFQNLTAAHWPPQNLSVGTILHILGPRSWFCTMSRIFPKSQKKTKSGKFQTIFPS